MYCIVVLVCCRPSEVELSIYCILGKTVPILLATNKYKGYMIIKFLLDWKEIRAPLHVTPCKGAQSIGSLSSFKIYLYQMSKCERKTDHQRLTILMCGYGYELATMRMCPH